MSNNGLISGSFSSDTTLSTPVAINKGGTGQTTAQAALDALAAASGTLVQGDIFFVDSSGNVVRLARGADDQSLVMNGNNPNWEAVSGGASTTFSEDTLSSDFTTTSSDLVDITGLTITLGSSGKFICSLNGTFQNGGAIGTAVRCAILHDGTVIRLGTVGQGQSSLICQNTISFGGSCDGNIIKCQTMAPTNTTTIKGDDPYITAFWSMEIF